MFDWLKKIFGGKEETATMMNEERTPSSEPQMEEKPMEETPAANIPESSPMMDSNDGNNMDTDIDID